MDLKELYLSPPSFKVAGGGGVKHPSARYHYANNGLYCGKWMPGFAVVCTRGVNHTGEHEGHGYGGEVVKRDGVPCRWT